MNEKELLTSALNEIRWLRRQNELNRARLDMFDDVMSALHGKPANKSNGLLSPDVVSEIEKYLYEANKVS